MMAYELKSIAILNVKGIGYRCLLWSITKNDAINMFGNSKLDDKGIMNMDSAANKTSVEVIKEGPLGGTYFRDIYSDVNGKWYRKSWKEFDELGDIDQKYYRSNYYDASVNKYGVKCGTSLRFWENKDWIKLLFI